MNKTIWIPQTKTRVTINGSDVVVWDEIVMVAEPIKPETGFGSGKPPRPENSGK